MHVSPLSTIERQAGSSIARLLAPVTEAQQQSSQGIAEYRTGERQRCIAEER